ncbi:PhoH family protein [Bifidobacterium choloepi]|uniref:PhoH-like protein n=1 Tax=Bifidobacterium choloepi TaxID=2614131 RepID=A0A6I5N632_9BIFI|nr:PhoH family protein [Bifidobacterium choloepi]NEG69241.1 PhoH family protein [Bifidobacterium choloepi]
MATTKRTVNVPAELDPVSVFGPYDEVLREVERAFPDTTIHVRGNEVTIRATTKAGEAEAVQAQDLLDTVIESAFTEPMDADMVRRLVDQRVLSNDVREEVPGHGRTVEALRRTKRAVAASGQSSSRADSAAVADGGGRHKPSLPGVIAYAAGQPVRPKTAGQTAYVNAIEANTITFGIGPAGTGKTYLAVAKAVRAFDDGKVRRIILTRPAVEAGERLGFLPGTLNEKVDPYLRPLYDALGDMLGADRLRRYLDDGTIEVAPLAYMRGRTLNDAFVILDEAQNTTEQQMKMFLTRLGFNTTMVVTGDVTQIDLEVPHSGLKSIERILGDIPGIAFVHLESADVVRHALVGRIVAAYEKADERREARRLAERRDIHIGEEQLGQ